MKAEKEGKNVAQFNFHLTQQGQQRQHGKSKALKTQADKGRKTP